ncbi:YuiB family protein [Caldalkalibacillus mannanilyticus]|uniref:YuiB family protein n=1 Tax=Caldalkalibacillus mannanilyticus TaxID=1418 RepID=UPI000469ACA8|nr:YuiB family protein [Caldalkalibacillus mannanilyticus]
MPLLPAQFVISLFLFPVLFFGIGFLLNMLLKTTWFPGAILYPLIVVVMVSYYGQGFGSLLMVDIIILSSGLIGALLSGYIIKVLRQRGYRMF